MSKVIESRIQTFKASIEEMSPSKVKMAIKKEVKLLLSEYKATSVRRYLTLYRKALKDFKSVDYKDIRLDDKSQRKIEVAQSKKVAKTNKKLLRIRRYERLISDAIELLDSDKVSEITCALCLLTGRRMSEILKTAKFTNSRNSQKVVMFKGQLKTRDQNSKYEIYTLGNSRDKCKKALKRLRQIANTKNLSPEQVNSKYKSTVNYKVTPLFGKYIGTASAHDLRKVYITIASKLYKDDSQSDNSFYSQILGHNSEDLSTANTYHKYYVKN
tara:strand:- start:1511 stop:2323 length:813 start_codon:yes stop_codon:yes gene_type:complete